MDEQFIDDILENGKKKKKVNGKSKGNRTELILCKMLTKHFGKEFSRAPGSGARTSQVAFLPEHAKKTLTGDICVPEGFQWVIECKGGYESDMHLENILNGDEGLSRLDEFIEQVLKDSEYCGRKPIILWKRNRKPWIAMYREFDLPSVCLNNWMCYKSEWRIVNFEDMLQNTTKGTWFDEKKNSSN